MAIKGLYDNLGNASPTVGIIKIGVLMPTCCLRPEIYAESPDIRKCVNDKDGECPFITQKADFKHPHRNEKKRFEYTTRNSVCPAARWTTEQCAKKDFPTKPEKLPYFLMPDEVKLALGLDYRPTKIPNVMFMSNEIQEKRNPETQRIVSYTEPEDVCRKYPISDAGLYYWTQNDLCCFGDGENATEYPSSPTHISYNKPRVCAYKECPDFKKHLCYEVGKLYFRIPNAPGFPGLWMLQTKSMKAMKGIVKELESYYWSYQQRISLMPMSLELRKEKASPEINRKVDGEWTKVKTKTHVYRVHVVPATTMGEMQKALGQATLYLTGEVQTEIKALQAAAPKALPLPSEPIEEALATDTEEGEYEDIQQETQPEPAPEPPKKAKSQPKPQPEAPKQEAPAQPQPHPERPSELTCVACGGSGQATSGRTCGSCGGRGSVVRTTPAKPATSDLENAAPAPAAGEFDQKAALMVAAQIEKALIIGLEHCRSKEEVNAYAGEHKGDFADYVSTGFVPKDLIALKKRLLETLPDVYAEETAVSENLLEVKKLIEAGRFPLQTAIAVINKRRAHLKIPGEIKNLADASESDLAALIDAAKG